MPPEQFFLKLVPEAWNRRLDEQAALGPGGAQRLQKMREATFTLRVEIEGPEGGTWSLAIREGRMETGSPAEAPLLATLRMSVDDWRRLAEEVGPSPMALVGGIAGKSDFALTGSRVAQLRDATGTIRLSVTGAAPWGMLIHFGEGAIPAEPTTTISIAAEEYAAIRSGDLDLPRAFMTGKLTLDGDVELAMKLALGLMGPD